MCEMIAIVVAMTPDRVIGKDGEIPWYIPEDMKHFKELTSGHTVLMGRKTFESLPESYTPLPDRNNIVVSTTMEEREGIDVCRSVEQGLEKAESYEGDLYVIGGESIYEQTLDVADKMFISVVDRKVDGDTYFPEFDKSNWMLENEKEFDEFILKKYRRKE